MYPIQEYFILVAVLTSAVLVSSDEGFNGGFVNSYLKKVEYVYDLENILTAYPDSHYAKSAETSCSCEMLQYKRAIESRKTWALHMLDASSKIPPGILMGSSVDLGVYDQCVGVHPQENVTDIQGRHCMFTLSLPESLLLEHRLNSGFGDPASNTSTSSSAIELSLSVCVPSSCEGTDVQQILNDVIANFSFLGDTGMEVIEAKCSRVGSDTWGIAEMIIITFLLVVVLFLVVCTICHFIKWYFEYQDSRTLGILSKFSLYLSAKEVFNTETSPQSFPVIHGLRCLSMINVILVHQFISMFLQPVINRVEMMNDWVTPPKSHVFSLVIFAVDTFLVISGFLRAHIFMKNMREGATFNLSKYYIHRYIRLTPCVAIVTLISMYVVDHLGSGPLWDLTIGYITRCCEENWWLNFVHLQNLSGITACGIHLWYLAIDMQLYWLSPIILYPLYRWPKVGLTILSFLLVGSIVTPGAIGATRGYSSSFFREDKSSLENIDEIQSKYFFLHTRAAPWLIGVCLGYLIVDREERISKMKLVFGWLITIFAFTFCVFLYQPVLFMRHGFNMVWETFTISMMRPLWGFAIAWIIYVCTLGYGGPLTKFLSQPIFVPLSKLSYCIYIVHLFTQVIRAATVRTFIYMTVLDYASHFCFDLVMSSALGFVLHLLFEAPIEVLEKVLTDGRGSFEMSKSTKTIKLY